MDKVAIIDDDIEFLDICSELLIKYGFSTYKIDNNKDLTYQVEKILPDLILLDWNMPYKDGIQITNELKKNIKLRNVPVIIITGVRNRNNDLAHAFDHGAIDYIKKPFDELELITRIKSAIVQSRKNPLEFYDQILHEIERKDKQLVLSNNNYYSNNYVLSLVKKELVVLLSKNKLSHQIDNIIRKLKSNNKLIYNSVNEEIFVETESDFIKRLKEKHPDLTKNEIKICSFFRIGYSTKEVSSITFMSYESVRKSVYRIRKKLKLIGNKLSIFDYLNTI